jgi:phenylalanyl-tRNA synthetase beta chain
MKISEGWLREHLDTPLSFEDLGHILTSIGLEVEASVPPRTDLIPFVTARILEAQPHPDAQKLRICRVQAADGQILQVVCGAPNARAGLNGVLAPEGVTIPSSGLVIRKATLRGVESQGMLCSAQELGLPSDSDDGIIELPEGTPAGLPYAAVAGLDEGVWVLNITPNRGDCLSVRGIARDLAARGVGALRPWHQVDQARGFSGSLPLAPAAHKALHPECPLFATRVIRGLKPGQTSPLWLKARLRQAGLKSVSAVVDALQWVMMDTGQPMHAYDGEALRGPLQVRGAAAGMAFGGLNGQTFILEPHDLVVHDGHRPVALAGILGSACSAWQETTTTVCLESALFDPASIARSGQRLMIPTDARSRFERGVDPTQVLPALDRATALILDLCGGEVTDTLICGAVPNPDRPSLVFDPAAFTRRTGVVLDGTTGAVAFLERLGCTVTPGSPLRVTPPAWRHDLTLEEDLHEEILRLKGYDAIPPVPPAPRLGYTAPDPVREAHQRSRLVMAQEGFLEAVNFSFVHSQSSEASGFAPKVFVQNPVARELDALRVSLLPRLVEQLARNRAHGHTRGGLFEVGPVFHGTRSEDQIMHLAAAHSAVPGPGFWNRPAQAFDVFAMKACLWRLFRTLGLDPDRLGMATEEAGIPTLFHPSRFARLTLGKVTLGLWGEIHPARMDALELDGPVIMAEVNLDACPVARSKAFPTPWAENPWPVVERDFAFIVEGNGQAGDLIRTVRKVDPVLVRDVHLFDVYTDPAWPAGRCSYGLRVQMQSDQGTLAESQIRDLSNRIAEAVQSRFAATLRQAGA